MFPANYNEDPVAWEQAQEEAVRQAEKARVWYDKYIASADEITDPTVVEVANAIAVKYDFEGWAKFRADWYVPGIGFGGRQEEVPAEQVAAFVHTNTARVKLVIKADADRFSLPIAQVATAHRRKYVEGRDRRPGPMAKKDILARTPDWK